MKWLSGLAALILFSSFLLFSFFRNKPGKSRIKQEIPGVNQPSQLVQSSQKDSLQSKIQVVFALDATGSMSGLIGAAKEKIWSIAGSLAQAEPAPVIEMGLLFYRDRGDVFITKQIPLSRDLDQVYAVLMQIAAGGGGDQPESVNQALYEAVSKFRWDTSFNTYKTIFLVGDCPPHMDYRDDVKYPQSCQAARQKDIVLNTILMGDNQSAKRIWNEIATCNQGSFTQVNMNANDIVIYTPYDSVIAALSDQLDETRLYYGTASEKSAATEKISRSKDISTNSKPNIKAQRAEYNTTKAGKGEYYGKQELLESYKTKSVQLEDIRNEELPEQMKTMTPGEKKEFIEQKVAEREKLQKELATFSAKRQEYISADLKKRSAGEVDSSFSNQVYKSIQKQTERKKIYLKAETKY